MKIFIACSKENIEKMNEIERWLEESNHEVLRWDQPGLFPPGEQTFITLINISKQIDGAICLFSEDDKVWYRGDAAMQPRDNVLIEYGLFAGALGPRRAIICKCGSPRRASDILGLTVIEINDNRKAFSREEIKIWANKLKSNPIDPVLISLKGRIHELELELESSRRETLAEREKSDDLEKILERRNIINFSEIDLNTDGHWKLLFSSKYFDETAQILVKLCDKPAKLKQMLNTDETKDVCEQIAWQTDEENTQKTYIMARKVLRVFRRYYDSEKYLLFLKKLPEPVKDQITTLAQYVVKNKRNVEE